MVTHFFRPVVGEEVLDHRKIEDPVSHDGDLLVVHMGPTNVLEHLPEFPEIVTDVAAEQLVVIGPID